MGGSSTGDGCNYGPPHARESRGKKVDEFLLGAS